MFKHKLIIKGTSHDLDAIYNGLNFDPAHGEMMREADPSQISKEQRAQLLTGKMQRIGTTSVTIRCNVDPAQLKADILKRFPAVLISEQ